MRVTAGKYKGRVLEENKFEHIRPTADMVKQAIFNKINFDLQGAKVLDLFCGTGALGIEAISRGASEVVFADKDARSISLTIKNLNKLGLTARVLNATYQNAIKRLSGEKFDIIILDPPYKSGLYEDCVKLIYQSDLLNENGIIVEQGDYSKIPSLLDFAGGLRENKNFFGEYILKKYSSEMMTKNYISVYNRIMNEKTGE